MPHTPQHQFDPVAASAIAALNATQRTGRNVRQQAGLPEPPGAETALNQSRNVLQQVSAYSPLNMLGSPGGPSLPGTSGQGGLPNPANLLPGNGAQNALPNPEEFIPGQGTSGLMPPLPGQQQSRGATGRRQRPDRARSSDGNGGASETEEDHSPGRRSEDTRS